MILAVGNEDILALEYSHIGWSTQLVPFHGVRSPKALNDIAINVCDADLVIGMRTRAVTNHEKTRLQLDCMTRKTQARLSKSYLTYENPISPVLLDKMGLRA